MKLPTILLCASAIGLAACETYPPSPPPVTPVGGVTVTTASKAPFGTYLVDGSGRALYILEGTRGNVAPVRCDDDCLRVWPSLMAASPPTGGTAIDPRLLSTRPAYRGMQVTYAGWPLYYYHHDQAPSDTTGQHVMDRWGTWHLLSPSGEPIRPRP